MPTKASATRSPLLRSVTTTPSSILLGDAPITRNPVEFALSRLRKNVYVVGPTGEGKTSVVNKILQALALGPNPMLVFDYIGTGFDEIKNFVGFTGTLLKMVERTYASTPLHLAVPFLKRWAFALLSERSRTSTGIDLPVRINLLKRRYINDRWEAAAEVVGRVIRMFDVRFAGDMGIRVQFNRVVTALLATMVAADIPLNRWEEVLRGGDVMDEVRRAQARNGTAGDPYVQTQNMELAKIHLLRGGKSTREFDLLTGSTVNALAGYRRGTLLGEFFSGETFDPASVVFGGCRLFVSTDLADSLLRREAFAALYALFGALSASRALNVQRYPRLIEVIDEIAWVPQSLATDLAQVRNLGVSYIVSHQDAAQWRQYEMPYMADMIGSLFPTRIVFRPSTVEEAKNLVIASGEIDPGGYFIEKKVISDSAGESINETVTDSWQEMLSTTGSSSHGLSRPEALPGDETRPRATANEGTVVGRGTSAGGGGSSAQGAGKSWAKTTAQVLYRITTDEQVTLRAHGKMRRPLYEATIIEDGRGRDVALAAPRKFPRALFGADIRGHYDQLHDVYWRSKDASPPVDVPLTVYRDTGLQPDERIVISDVTPAAVEAPVPEHAAVVHSTLSGLETRVVALLSAALVRHTTGQHVMLLKTGCTYDAAMRALAKLTKSGDLAQVRPPAAKGAGSAPILFNLTEKGARTLADLGLYDLENGQRLARSVLAQKRAIEEGAPTLVRHQRYVGWVVASLLASIMAKDPTSEFPSVAWDPAIEIDLADIAPVLSHAARKRLGMAGDTKLTYRPDALIVAKWTPGTAPPRAEPFAIEVETSFGEQPQNVIGEAKSACVAAAVKHLRREGELAGQSFDRATPFRVVVWHRRSDAEERFVAGAAAIERGAAVKLPMLITSGDRVPLWLPKGTPKRDIRQALSKLVATLDEAVFRTPADPTALRPLIIPPSSEQEHA